MALATPCPVARISVDKISDVATQVVQLAAIMAIRATKLKAISHDRGASAPAANPRSKQVIPPVI